MAIKLVKKQPAQTLAEPEVEGPSELELAIDEVGRLQKESQAIVAKIAKLQEGLKPYNDAFKNLKALIEGLHLDDDAKGEIVASAHRLEYGKKGTAREFKPGAMTKVRELMGDELFFQVATVKLKDVDDYLTPPQKELILDSERTARTIKVVELVPAKTK